MVVKILDVAAAHQERVTRRRCEADFERNTSEENPGDLDVHLRVCTVCSGVTFPTCGDFTGNL